MVAERYATTSRAAARISSGEALSPALADMCDQATLPSARINNEPPSCAAFPTVRVWILRLRAPAMRPCRDAPGAEQLGHARDLCAGGPVADPVLIGEHGKLDPLPAAELGGVARSRLADQHEPDAGGFEIAPGAIQLDRVILTEDSPVMPQPDECGGALAPQLAETDVVALVVRKDDLGESVGARRRGRFAGGHARPKLLRDTPRGGSNRAQAPVDTLTGVDRPHHADALPGVARGEARPAVRGLSRSVALVGVRHRRVLEVAGRVPGRSLLRGGRPRPRE